MNDEPMTAERLQAIRARCEAATPGPWIYTWTDEMGGPYLSDSYQCQMITTPKDEEGKLKFILDIEDDGGKIEINSFLSDEDGRFIAHARQDIPDLLAEVERLEAELVRLRGSSAVIWSDGAYYVPGTPDTRQERDDLVELLIPFIPKRIRQIWECACGEGKMSNVFIDHGYYMWATDIRDTHPVNFLTDNPIDCLLDCTAIITNPPYSLKRKFFERCLYFSEEYGFPFALLIPADYCLWTIDAIRIHGCEKIIPTRRIDFITPTGRSGGTSSSDYHSMWLTKGFGLGRSETFVELTTKMKSNI
jgi:hypothetical protein